MIKEKLSTTVVNLRSILIILLTATIVGCAQLQPQIAPDYHPPQIDLPTHWTPTSHENNVGLVPGPTRNLARWWKQLNDFDLDQLINTALAENLNLKLAQARLRQARANRDQALSGLYPSLSASTGVNQNKYASGIKPLPTSTIYNVGFDASWELDIFGSVRYGIEAADAEQATSEANLSNVQVSLVAEIARNYVDLRTYQQRLKIAQDNLASQGETLQLTEWSYKAGLSTSSDVEQARTVREQTRASIPDLKVGMAAAENRLAVLTGRNPGALHQQLMKPRTWPNLPATIGTGIPADVLKQRPDLIAAERTLAAETARVGQKLANRYPNLNLNATFGWQAYTLGALSGPGALAQTFSGTLAAMLFDGGKLKSAVNIQNAVQEQALISYKNSVLGALEEVENALIAYAAGREQTEARRAAATAAGKAAALSRDLYKAGLTNLQKVLDTERARLSTEDSLAIAEANMRTNLIQLYKALGGGWETTTTANLSLPPSTSNSAS